MTVGEAIKIMQSINSKDYAQAFKELDGATSLNKGVTDYLRTLCIKGEVTADDRTPNRVDEKPSFNYKTDSCTLDTVLNLMLEEKYDEAFDLVIEIKGRGNQENVDFFRALLFIINDPQFGHLNAFQALLEELRHYPDNEAAATLLEEVRSTLSDDSEKLLAQLATPEEFRQWYRKIKNFSMLPLIRLYNLYLLAKEVCEKDIPGDFVECGVAGGGSSALLALVVQKYSRRQRKIFACDSFEGMPEPGEEDRLQGVAANETGWGTGTCAAPEESLKSICSELSVSSFVKPVKGWFENTLPGVRRDVSQIALLHVDCDWYESTLCVFNNLYDKVTHGAPVQVDDYGYWEGMRKALDEFFSSERPAPSIQSIDGMSAWFVAEHQR